ncbi:MAG: pectate lyase, partial [Pseudomonadota bacterium]
MQERFSDSGDSPGAINSSLVLCEDNLQLGPAHSLHADIAKLGRGRYSHWGKNIVFSTSDNSDPNTN